MVFSSRLLAMQAWLGQWQPRLSGSQRERYYFGIQLCCAAKRIDAINYQYTADLVYAAEILHSANNVYGAEVLYAADFLYAVDVLHRADNGY